jgi:predicted GNAT family acetyltransferase
MSWLKSRVNGRSFTSMYPINNLKNKFQLIDKRVLVLLFRLRIVMEFKELNSKNWTSFEELFGEKGACGGCWCMTWRLTSAEYEKLKGVGNKKAMKQLVSDKLPLGIIAFEGNEPVGWCSVSPRKHFVRLANSRILKAVDNKEVWSIVCFFIKKGFRRQGMSVKLIKAAVNFAKAKGAKTIEAYPVEPKKKSVPEVFVFTGLASAFFKAGFTEVARNSETRPIVRKETGF